ncbi:MAG: FHA domain-containing protein [Planctomycetes bacterium]|nr:FHA domain-containing protein [Planctomycetota bacterium]
MDDFRRDAEAAGLAGSGSHAAPDCEGLPPHFVPLRLVMRPGGVAVELTRPDMLLGRHSEADVRLPLPDVSRRHCRFVFSDGSWHVRDLKSLNGTYVNEQAVEYTAIFHGDTVRIGGFVFGVDLAGADGTAEGVGTGDGVLLSITHALPRPDGTPPVQRQAS